VKGNQLNFKLINAKELTTSSLLALNGVRVGRTLIDSVAAGRIVGEDDQVDLENSIAKGRIAKYQIALRFIKYWARQRGIYSNVMGYFGGVSWAILLVKIALQLADRMTCELVVDACTPYELVIRFFRHFHEWSWGPGNPVTLKPLPANLALFLSTLRTPNSTPTMSSLPSPDDDTTTTSAEPANSSTRTILWDPSTNDGDRKSLMPILTPISPYMNSTFNVLVSTHRILVDEFRRAASMDITDDILYRLCAPASGETRKFAFRLPLRLSVITTGLSDTEQKRLLFVWKSLVESKLRVLLFHLEKINGLVCRPVPPHDGISEFAILMSFVPSEDDDEHGRRLVDLNPAVSQFHGALSTAIEARKDKEELQRYCRLEIGTLTATRHFRDS
jgi:poly(A) polymerase Pap1